MIVRFFSTLSLSLLLISCTPIGALTTIGTTAGTMAMEERGFEGASNDYSLKGSIVSRWATADLSFATDLTVIVYNSKAMIVGSVDTEEERATAIATAWEVEGIQEVFNEIKLKQEWTLQDFAHDTWIDTKLLAKLTFDGNIMDINYKYETEGGTVYVIGIAQSKAELNRFIAHAKSMPYVKKVVSHVEIKQRQSMFKENPNKIHALSDANIQ